MRSFDLIALSVVAAVMAVVVVVGEPPSDGTTPPRRIVPEHRALRLVGFERRPAQGAVESFAVGSDGVMAMTAPVSAPLDPVALADFTGALELLTPRRVVEGGNREDRGLAPANLELELRYHSGPAVVLELGAYLSETDQYWLARQGRSRLWLVDGYAGRALARSGDQLRSRRPLPTRHRDVTGIEISAADRSVVLSGRPLALHMEGGGRVRLHPDARRSILAGLDNLRLTRFAKLPDQDSAPGFSVRVLGGEGPRDLSDHGPCPGVDGQRLVSTPVGAGCVSEAALAEIALVLDFRDRLIDTHLVDADAGKPVAIEIARGSEALSLEAVGGGWRTGDGKPADLHAVLEWARALDSVATGPARPAPASARVIATASLAYPGGRTDRIELLSGGLVRRGAEPIAYPAGASAAELFEPGTPRFRDRAVWSRDPSTVRRIARRGAGRRDELVRGELLEDWSVVSPKGGEVERARIDELLETLSRLRAERYVGGRLGTSALTLEVDFDDGRETLELAKPCRARRDTDATVFVLTAEDCALLFGDW